ncbi:hypothetical protein conserved [Leishmania donovani]|nr:hypothetical protein conserved [Leishmania donovani]
MLRLTSWRLGGAVSRAAAAAKQRGRKPRSGSARGRRPSKPGRKAVSRSATPKATRGRPSSQGRGRGQSRGRGRPSLASSPSRSAKDATKPAPPVKAKATTSASDKDESNRYASARPAYMSAEREQEVLQMAERMQTKDTSTEVPVASFAYEILKAHPSVRDMGLRERMDFLLKRWNRLSKAQKLDYVNDPLRGLL